MTTVYTEVKRYLAETMAGHIDHEVFPTALTLQIFGFAPDISKLKQDQVFAFVVKFPIEFWIVYEAVQGFVATKNGQVYADPSATSNEFNTILVMKVQGLGRVLVRLVHRRISFGLNYL